LGIEQKHRIGYNGKKIMVNTMMKGLRLGLAIIPALLFGQEQEEKKSGSGGNRTKSTHARMAS
jgi:hypothetical protein